MTAEYNQKQSRSRRQCDPPNAPECQDGGSLAGGFSCCFQGNFEWDWGRFGTSIVGGALVGAGTAWGVNAIPGVGPIAYGTTIAAGAIEVGLAYTWNRCDDWMWSEATGGSGGERCVLFADPYYANIK